MPSDHHSELRLLLEGSPIAVAVFDAEGHCTYANQANLALCRRTEAEFRGLPGAQHYFDPDERKGVTEELRAKGSVHGREVRIARGDGTYFWALLSVSVLPRAGGGKEGEKEYVTWVLDISQRKQAEEELKESERLTLSMLDHSPMGARITRALDNTVVYVNARYAEQFGVPRDELIGSPVIGAYAEPSEREQVIGRFFERGRLDDEEVVFKRANGEAFSVLMSMRPFQYGGEEARLAWFYDITERKKIEDGLRESERLTLSMIDDSPVGARVTRASDNVIVFVNTRYAEQFGVPKDMLIGSLVVGAYADPAARQVLIDRFYADDRLDDEEVLFKRASGEEFLALMSMRPFQYGGEEARLAWFYDITERKRAEEELRAAKEAAEAALADLTRTQKQLVTAEKLASLGRVTAGIAHEIKNPLNFVNNFSETSVELLGELKEAIEPLLGGLDADQRDDVKDLLATLSGDMEKIHHHGRRADSIMKSMLLHARGDKGERASVALNELISEAFKLAYHGERARDKTFQVTMEEKLDEGVGAVDVVPQDLMRVLINLFTNAFYAVKERASEAAGNGYAPTVVASTAALGDSIEIKVRDNGTGIPPEVRAHLFDPFFTTKPTGEGTGLGLSMSYDIIVNQHGGEISVASEPSAFTEFVIRLPRRRTKDAGQGGGA